MARICIPDHEYKERVQRCTAILRREKLDALIVNGNEADYANPRYFSGFWPLFERAGVAISAGGDAALMVGPESREFGADRNKLDKIFCLKAYREGADPSYPELQADTFQDVFKAIGVTGQKLRIGIASFLDTSMTIYQAICDAFPGAEFVNAGYIMTELRQIKSENELACLREGYRLADLATKQVIKEIQMIFQDPQSSLNERAKVDYIVSEGLINIHPDMSKEERSQKVAQALLDVGLLPEFASRFPHEFSGGQRQRIGIARSLIMEPEFIIADEPISALDVSIRAQVLNLMSRLQKERGLTYLFIAHDLSVMRFICDRIAVIHKGVIVELSETEKLFAHPLHPYTRALLSAIPMPDPESEKKKVLEVYDPSQHHYETDKPVWTEIEPGHFIMANQEELAKYKAQIGK